jgi:O-antigen/teichoic acid export membrane protein
VSAVAPAPVHPALEGLKRRAMSLGAAHAVDFVLQFLLPMILARALDANAFGEYRLLWLAVGTVLAVCMLGMTHGLYYFMPRASAPMRRLYVHQTLLFLVVVSFLSALYVSPWNPWLPEAMAPLAAYGAWVPTFVAIWVTTTLIDVLPMTEERTRWAVFVISGMAVVRFVVLAAAALLTNDVSVLVLVLIALAVLKLGVLLFYVGRFHGFDGPWFERRAFAEQVRGSTPFGISSSLFGLRIQIDQWVAASMFTLQAFAAFSVAAVLSPLVSIFRLSVNDAFLPNMSRMQADGDVRGMMALNGRANMMVTIFVAPILALAFAFAEEIVTVVYTAAYIEGAPVMRVYILGLLMSLVEVGSVLLMLKLGGFALRMNALALALSVALAWTGAIHFGLPGAAMGSVAAVWFDRFLTLRKVARETGLPVSELQDWKGLATLVASSAIAAGLAATVVHVQFSGSAPLVRLLVGGTVLAVVYALLLAPRYWSALSLSTLLRRGA